MHYSPLLVIAAASLVIAMPINIKAGRSCFGSSGGCSDAASAPKAPRSNWLNTVETAGSLWSASASANQQNDGSGFHAISEPDGSTGYVIGFNTDK